MIKLKSDTPETIEPGLYQHYKGPLYRVIGLTKHSETEESLVLYQTLYGERDLWSRPYSMFVESVHSSDGDVVPRFAYANEQTLVLEVAHLSLKPGTRDDFLAAFAQARELIERQDGFIFCELKPKLGTDLEFLLQVGWQTVEHHKNGFRNSSDYQEWSRLLHHFYEPFPSVEYYQL